VTTFYWTPCRIALQHTQAFWGCDVEDEWRWRNYLWSQCANNASIAEDHDGRRQQVRHEQRRKPEKLLQRVVFQHEFPAASVDDVRSDGGGRRLQRRDRYPDKRNCTVHVALFRDQLQNFQRHYASFFIAWSIACARYNSPPPPYCHTVVYFREFFAVKYFTKYCETFHDVCKYPNWGKSVSKS